MQKIRGVGESPGFRRDLLETTGLQSEAARACPPITEPKVLYSPGPGEKVDPTNRTDRAGQKTLNEALVAVAMQLGLVYSKPGNGIEPGPAGVTKKLVNIRHRVRGVIQADCRQDRLGGAWA